MEQQFRRFADILEAATGAISEEYFQLPVAEADAVYRERVYCYELYHQLQCRWASFPYSLAGEVDKAGHPHFRDGPYSAAKPDLLVHSPGNMAANLAVVEVKAATVTPAKIKDDIVKLEWFCDNACYFRGIFLLYGEAGEEADVASSIAKALGEQRVPARICCLYHRTVRSPATVVCG
jgi:hypothetical protein